MISQVNTGLLSGFARIVTFGLQCLFLLILSILLIQNSTPPCYAGDFLSLSGRLDLRGGLALDSVSV
jgi:hypothetical protein